MVGWVGFTRRGWRAKWAFLLLIAFHVSRSKRKSNYTLFTTNCTMEVAGNLLTMQRSTIDSARTSITDSEVIIVKMNTSLLLIIRGSGFSFKLSIPPRKYQPKSPPTPGSRKLSLLPASLWVFKRNFKSRKERLKVGLQTFRQSREK